MKYVFGTISSLAVGIALGFFGVFNSVFTDGGFAERIGTIAIIVTIYAVLSSLLGFFLPKYSWLWGLLLCMPGVLMLILYMRSEFNPLYLAYMTVLLAVSCLGAYGSSKLRERSTRKTNDLS